MNTDEDNNVREEGNHSNSRGKSCLYAVIIVGVISGVSVWYYATWFFAERERAREATSANNLKSIAFALEEYHAFYGQLPQSNTRNRFKERLFSWRVAVLPFMYVPG